MSRSFARKKETQDMRTHLMTLIAGVLVGMALLTTANGLLPGQASTAAAGGAAVDSQAVMRQAATPEAGDAEMAEKMERMMDQCLAMMEMMSMMMGGDMSGMMGGEEMQGMEGMEDMPAAAATPEP